jgi:undecaprenyl-diphosphatase
VSNSNDLASSCDSVAAVDLGFVELSWLQMAVLGVIQGITELLPISSTAHLRVIPAILGWRDPGSAFSAAMQLASFAAVIVYFRKDIGTFGGATLRAVASKDFAAPDFRVVLGILLGTIPLVIVGLLLKPVLNACHSPMRGLMVIGVASIVMSLSLALAEKIAKHRRSFGQITLRDGVIVGIAQAFAVIPGVSRSGATLTAAVTLAGLFELRVLFKAGLNSDGWMTLLIGLLFASVAAFAAIYGLLRYLERRSTWIFIWYRLIFGLGIVFAVLGGYLPN